MSTQRVAVVTGTSTGFGFLTAKRLAEEGFRVFGTMRGTSGRNAGPKRELEAAGATVVEMDVTDAASVERAAAAILTQAGRVDVLVNNAGTAHFGPAEAFTEQSFEQQFATNVTGPFRVSRAFLPTMRAQRSGLVVFVSSTVGRFVVPYMGVYTASKFAIEALGESMSYELRQFGVDVAIVEPGAYATNIGNAVVTPDDTDRALAYGTEGVLQKIFQALRARMGDAGDVAEVIVTLAKAAPGTRPLRTPTPAGTPVEAVNRAIEPLRRSVVGAFGMGDFLPKASVA